MPTLKIDNVTNVTNVNGVTLTVTPVTNAKIGVITVAGPKGDKGDTGAPGSGNAVTQDILNATGALLNSTISNTGAVLYADILSVSGLLGAGGITQSQLNATGALTTALSGYVNLKFALNPSGYITGFNSGLYATVANQIAGDTNLSGSLALTGQQAWLAANNNALNLSGIVFATGAALISINLSTSGALILSLNASGQTLQSSIVATGSFLYGSITGLSYALNQTGQILLGVISNTGQQAWNAAQSNAINLSGNYSALSGALTQSGAALLFSIANSGQQAWTAANSNAINISGNVSALSGALVASGAKLSAVQVTGSAVIQNANFTGMGGTLVIYSGGYILISGAAGSSSAANNGDGINLSGNLSATGNTLWQRDLSISGALAAQISANAAGVSTLNGLSGGLSLVGTGSLIAILNSGQVIYVSGNNNDGLNLSGKLFNTGASLSATDAAISGNLIQSGVIIENQISLLSGQIISSGQISQGNAINLSGNISALSGALVQSGSNLQSQINTVISNLVATGLIGQGNAINLSGNYSALSGSLIQSGASLLSVIANSGSQAWNAANNNGINTSGAIAALSGSLGQSGAKLSAVQVTGSSTIQVANFSGIGGTLLIYSGGLILISGASASASVANNGDGINLSGNLTNTGSALIARDLLISGALAAQMQASAAGVSTLNSLSGAVSIVATGAGITIFNSGQSIFISGSSTAAANNSDGINLSGALFNTGSILSTSSSLISGNLTQTGTLLTNLIYLVSGQISSGDVANDLIWSGTLSNKISSTGSLLWQRDIDISGAIVAQMAAGGSIVKVSGSAPISTANLVGTGSVLVTYDGNNIIISGSASQGVGGGTNVSITGGSALSTANFTGIAGVSVTQANNSVIVSGNPWVEITVNFSTGKPVYDKTFTITDARISSSSRIAVLPCGKTAAGQMDGDALWDMISYAAYPQTGQFLLYASVYPGPVMGNRLIQYQIT